MRPWMVVGLGLVLAVPISTPTTAQSDAGRAGAGARWRDAGVVMHAVPKAFMADASTSGVFVAVGSSGPASTVARRSGGQWHRVTVRIGSPVGVDVNDSGDAEVLSVRSDGAVLATAWQHGATRPHTSVVVPASVSPAAPTAELVANGRGDLAAVVRGKSGPVVLVRKALRKPWGHPLSIGPSRYHARLDSIDVGNGGVVVGAFRKGPKLTMRSVGAGASRFGPAEPVATWREPGRHPVATQVHADIQIGRGGDVATLWSYRLGAGRTALLDVLPSGGHRFEKRMGQAGLNELAAVGDDGSVLLSGGLRWNPHSRRLARGSSLTVLDADSRGDAFMGSTTHSGAVAVWPMGRPQRARVAPPTGRQVDAVLTTDLLVYFVVVDAARHELTLRTRAF
jgi:hypothetical protein